MVTVWQAGRQAASIQTTSRTGCSRKLQTGCQKCVRAGTAPVPVFPRQKPGAAGSKQAYKDWSMRLLLHWPMPAAPFASAYMAHSSGIDCRAAGLEWHRLQGSGTGVEWTAGQRDWSGMDSRATVALLPRSIHSRERVA